MRFSRPLPIDGSGQAHIAADGGVVVDIRINPEAAIFGGHYPHFPILPGVYLIELALQTVEHHLRQLGFAAARLRSIKSARMLLPVLPGATVTCDARQLSSDSSHPLSEWDVTCLLGDKPSGRIRFTVEGVEGEPS